MALQRRTPATEKATSTADIPLLSAGDHDGRLVMVADLGLQKKEFKGEFKGNIQQIALGVEVVGETIEVDGNTVPRLLWTKPFYIYDSLTEKGAELKYYKVFDSSAKEGQVPDWESQLGKPCNIVVIHKQGKGDNAGKFFDNVEALTPIPEKYQAGVPPATIEFALGDGEDVQEHLYGLAKYVFDNRVQESNSDY